jgi:GNAT superfamily N-acetyltransferase
MPWPFDDKPVPPVPLNALQYFRGDTAPQGNALSAAMMGKQTTPLPADFFPQMPPMYEGEIRNALDRPYDRFARPIAEAISPTLGGYGMGQLGADTAMRASEGDWQGVAKNAPMLAMAAFPGVKGRRPHGSQIRPTAMTGVRFGDQEGGHKFALAPDGAQAASAFVDVRPDRVYIHDITTDPAMRRQGYATALVDDLLAEFPDKKVIPYGVTQDGMKFWRERYDFSNDGSISPKHRAAK